jgi:natural product biosynthesis luciferase-like monooxygenase protein
VVSPAAQPCDIMDSETTPNKRNCVLIGDDSLLLECAERLFAANFTIQAVFTCATRVQDWAKARGVSVRTATGVTAEDVADLDCDYVLSITWLRGLPQCLRDLPRLAAINIQDSPLPRYSGPHGPAWALMAQEQDFGICWHLAEQHVGDGAILQRVAVNIEPNDSTLSLNMKCFEAALSGFEALLVDLIAGNIKTVPHEEGQRQRFAKDQRPQHWGCLDWQQSAGQLEAIVRALDYGAYSNPFCAAKLWLGDSAVGVVEAFAEPESAQEQAAPGTVLMAAADCGLLIATAEGNLRITKVKTLHGEEISVTQLMESGALRVGQTLPALDFEQMNAMKALLPDLAESEAAWVQRLGAMDSLRLAYDQDPSLAADPSPQRCTVPVPSAFLERFAPEQRNAAIRTACLVHLSRLSRQQSFRVFYADAPLGARVLGHEVLLSTTVPLSVEFDDSLSFEQTIAAVDQQIDSCLQLPPFLHDLQGRSFDSETQDPIQLAEIGIVLGADALQSRDSLLVYRFDDSDSMWLEFAANRISAEDAAVMAAQLSTLLAAVSADSSTAIGHLEFLPAEVREQIMVEWNETTRPLPPGQLVHEMIRTKAAAMGSAIAVVAEGKQLTYTELEEQATHLAGYLVSLGAAPGGMVGICMQRTSDMMVALLAILKTGAAYLPLDPDFPPSRLRYMVEDSGVQLILSDCWSSGLVNDSAAKVILADQEVPSYEAVAFQPACPADLAYVIYTSGSTGDPKGVMLEHEQVTNFFLGMDERLGTDPGVWLAVTSLSFDISVLELLWTLTCGYKIVIFEGFDRGLRAAHTPAPHDAGQLEFSLMLWGASGGGPGSANPYNLMLDASRFADTHGFRAIWLPERHFHEFGGPYPNPAVAGAAIAAVTDHVCIRTGSVVLPFHNPVLMAEDWAMVDNLSGGRVGLGIASGWHPNDFVLEPNSYENRKQIMRSRIGTLRSLWRGEAHELPNPIDETPSIITLPRPVQPELPIWLTAAGNPETFRLAGEMGVNVLTHLLGQTTEEIVAKIGIYRQAWKDAGHPGSGHVTMMLHTMIGEDREQIHELARGPMCSYLATAADLLKDHMSAWAAVRTPMNRGELDTDFHLDDLSAEDVQDLLDFAYERYFESDALFGTPESCAAMIEKLRELEVDEVACLVDFGAEPELILQQLPFLEQLKRNTEGQSPVMERRESIEALIADHQVTHLQCTPSMATMLLAEPAIEKALGTLEVMMVGGEALTEDLAGKLRKVVPGRVMNMYGLTETAIWSSTADIEHNTKVVSLGEPLANNRFYVLDRNLQLVPPGLSGELFLAGLCVARGYLGRQDLTDKAFLPNTIEESTTSLLYRSGDQVRQLPDGTVRFLGRGDQQVKVNGYRIELGEIEAALLAHEQISQAIVLVVSSKFGVRVLVAHYVLEVGSTLDVEEMRSFLRTRLPEYMVPREFHVHASFPKTNNGKTDRKSLASGAFQKAVKEVIPVVTAEAQAPAVAMPRLSCAELEIELEKIWLDILGLQTLSRTANFFDLGGHSLLTIGLKRILLSQLGIDVALVALFRHSTIRSLAAFLEGEQQGTRAAGKTPALAKASAAGEAGSTAVKAEPQSAAAKRAALRKSRRNRS